MKNVILSLLLLAFVFSGSAFAEYNGDSSGITQTSAPAGRVTSPTKDGKIGGIQDPAPALWEPGRTDANYGSDSGGDSSSSSSSDDYGSYSSGD